MWLEWFSDEQIQSYTHDKYVQSIIYDKSVKDQSITKPHLILSDQ